MNTPAFLPEIASRHIAIVPYRSAACLAMPIPRDDYVTTCGASRFS